MLTIGIDARELVGNPAGKGQYLQRIVDQWLLTASEKLSLVLYVRAGEKLDTISGTDNVSIRVIPVAGRVFLWHRAVGKRLKQDGVAVFFAPLSYQSALWNPVPTVTVVHDLSVFLMQGFQHNRRSEFTEKMSLKRSVHKSEALIAVSQSTKNDLVTITGVAPESVTVTVLAALLAKQNVIPYADRKPYILFVGTLEPRKNIETLLRAYALLPQELRNTYSLVLAGKHGWGGEDYHALAEKLGIKAHVDFKGYVTTEDLIKLYREALLLVYPSWYEGFGLPVIEAMALGTPVVTSATSSLPEVVGDAGTLCEPSDASGISQAIQHYLTDLNFWQEKQKAVLQQAEKFSWEQTATQTLQILKRVSKGN